MHKYRSQRRQEFWTVSVGFAFVLVTVFWLRCSPHAAAQAADTLEAQTAQAPDAEPVCAAAAPSPFETLRTQWTRTVTRLPKVADLPEPRQKRYDQHIAKAAQEYEVDAALLRAVIAVESRYNRWARSSRGAGGLMQLMPDTARQYKVRDIFDPSQNVQAGARHLRYLLNIFNHDLPLALAAYNAGEGTVIKHGRRIPPYRETKAYVPKVLAYYAKYGVDPAPVCSLPRDMTI